jgi:hypothetical protein
VDAPGRPVERKHRLAARFEVQAVVLSPGPVAMGATTSRCSYSSQAGSEVPGVGSGGRVQPGERDQPLVAGMQGRLCQLEEGASPRPWGDWEKALAPPAGMRS